MSLKERKYAFRGISTNLHSLTDLLGSMPSNFWVTDKQIAGTIEHLKSIVCTFHPYKTLYTLLLCV